MSLKQLLKKWSKKEMLIWWTLLGVCAGIALGGGLYKLNCSPLTIELIGYPGELMVRALQELVLPLIVIALMNGVFNLRHTDNGTAIIMRWSLMYYLLSMFLAVGVGVALVYTIKPGRATPFVEKGGKHCFAGNSTSVANMSSSTGSSTVDSLLNIGRDVIPTNIVAAASQSNFLGVITFSILFAFTINNFGERAESFIRLIELLNDVILKIIFAVIRFTPLGIASLISSTILKACNLTLLLKSLGMYVGTILGGFCIHSFVILPLTIFLLSRQSPLKVFRSFLPALLMGLGTSSSAASMPVTMDCAESHGCDRSIVRFVIPLGTNINRDGAALYEAVSVIFICQAHGLHLSVGHVVIVVITATIAAIGSASIPNAALVSMITILQAVSLPQYISDISVLYAVDWFLGAFRTSVNIWGDACACLVVDSWAKKKFGDQDNFPIRARRNLQNQYNSPLFYELIPTLDKDMATASKD